MKRNALSRTLHTGRRVAGRVKRRLFPTPQVAAWRRLCAEASASPRYTPGVAEVMGYRLHHVDLLTIAPQWKDTFVDELQGFESTTPSPRILDCGANIGIVTLYLKRLYAGARITAFEADPAIAAALSRNISENHLSGVDVVQAAVWDEDGETTFIAEGSDAGGVADEYRGDATRRIRVPTVRLRNIIAAEERIDLLKLDIEGAEHRVLADCEPELYRVSAIAAELHDFDIRHRKAPATLALLSRAGFLYAHGGIVVVPEAADDARLKRSFPSPSTRWVERIYAWRE